MGPRALATADEGLMAGSPTEHVDLEHHAANGLAFQRALPVNGRWHYLAYGQARARVSRPRAHLGAQQLQLRQGQRDWFSQAGSARPRVRQAAAAAGCASSSSCPSRPSPPCPAAGAGTGPGHCYGCRRRPLHFRQLQSRPSRGGREPVDEVVVGDAGLRLGPDLHGPEQRPGCSWDPVPGAAVTSSGGS